MMSFVAACQFLTALPVLSRLKPSTDDIERGLAWFPVVGLLLGLLLAGLDRIALGVLDTRVASAGLLLVLVAVTGSLHLDGFIDTVCGLTAGPDAQSRLAVMHETIVSANGAIGGVWLLVATYAALASLPSPSRETALVVSPVMGRAMIVLAYHLFPYARKEGTVTAMLKQGATAGRTALGMVMTLAFATLLGGASGLILVAIALLIMLTLAFIARWRLGGLTGDVYGAICATTELGIWIAAPRVLLR